MGIFHTQISYFLYDPFIFMIFLLEFILSSGEIFLMLPKNVLVIKSENLLVEYYFLGYQSKNLFMFNAYLIYYGVLNFQFLAVGSHAKYNVSEHLASRRHWRCILVLMIKGIQPPPKLWKLEGMKVSPFVVNFTIMATNGGRMFWCN